MGITLGLRRPGAAVTFILLGILCHPFLTAQSAGAASRAHAGPVRRLYVDAFEGRVASAVLRPKVIARLRADPGWIVVDSRAEADAVVEGSGEIWLTGHLSNSPHPESGARQAVYGGYLSVEVKDRGGSTLWSYLVTPGRMHWTGVDRELADRLVRVMDREVMNGVQNRALNQRLAGSAAPASGLASGPAGGGLAIAGAGSTFAAPLYRRWIESFAQGRPGVHATYEAVGSEGGVGRLREGKVDFAASDVPLSGDQLRSIPAGIDQFPTVIGAVVVAYHLEGIPGDLRFTPEALSGIYLGKITRWNDRRLRALNPGVRLPDEPVVVVHRSEGSGTTFAFTELLSRTSAAWKDTVGAGMRVSWPLGVPAEGNEGVALAVSRTPGAIGYVELTYALHQQLSLGRIRNVSGRFVQANLDTLAAAARSAPDPGSLPASLVNRRGREAYPLTTLTWILVPASAADAQRRTAVRDLLRWMLTSGQRECAGLGYLPLPREMARAELNRLDPPGHSLAAQ